MVQSLLLVTLGFLVASLLALLAAPLLWRRAQRIMRKRLEAVVPMSLDEVRADRDALRAEQAMAMRRLEVENAEVRRIDAEHVIEIGRGREALKERADTIARLQSRIEALERREEQLTEQLRKRERELSALDVTSRTAAREVTRQRERAEKIAASLRAVEGEQSTRVDQIAALRHELGEANGRLVEAQAELARLKEPGSIPAASPQTEALDDRLAAAQTRVLELEIALNEANAELRPKLIALGERLAAIVGYLQADTTDSRPIGERVRLLLGRVEPENDDGKPPDDLDGVEREFDLVAERELALSDQDPIENRKVG